VTLRKRIALLGLVALSLGPGSGVLARSGSDSSGTHSYSLECVGGLVVGTNTGSGTIKFELLLPKVSVVAITLGAGESRNLGRGSSAPPMGGVLYYWVSFEDPDGSNNFYRFDEGRAPSCVLPISGDGFVAPGAEIGPGEATFGATGFAAGEEVDVVLHSTPRQLGTVTSDANGVASITFDLLASDGAGEHSVVFTGPSGTATIPFTLVLPQGSASSTTAVVGQLPVTR
jgi:hypothetical protein